MRIRLNQLWVVDGIAGLGAIQPTWLWVKTQIGLPPVKIPIPTKIGSKMGGEFTYPKMVPLVSQAKDLSRGMS